MASTGDYRGTIAIHIHSDATNINAAGIVYGGVGHRTENEIIIRKEVAPRVGSLQGTGYITTGGSGSAQSITNETRSQVISAQSIESETRSQVRSAQCLTRETSSEAGCAHDDVQTSWVESELKIEPETAKLGTVEGGGQEPPAREETGLPSRTAAAAGEETGLPSRTAAAAGEENGLPSRTAAAAGEETGLPSRTAAAAGEETGLPSRTAAAAGEETGLPSRTAAAAGEENGLPSRTAAAAGEGRGCGHDILHVKVRGTEALHCPSTEGCRTQTRGAVGYQQAMKNSDKRQKDNDFHRACKLGDLDRVVRILSEDLDNLNRKDSHGRTGLMVAAYQGHRDVVELLVTKGADLTSVDKGGDTVLHAACRAGDISIVKFVLSKDELDVNSSDKSGMTPAMSAARWGYLDVVKLLLRRGAKMQLVDDEGDTILHYACRGGHEDVVECIVSSDAALRQSQEQEWKDSSKGCQRRRSSCPT
ncbi:ankyrin-2-like isoform X2 [Haliotis rubra]|uniref:ankyrin-2-like isoform X2 n=1 Tax=Haliotis rubra TaxID=36100 RepID=UPI001EE52B10|nr:ankyrin-2-like isoform X2 [Haliotis rubra]